jgi:ketosteroid isomerase-like protein
MTQRAKGFFEEYFRRLYRERDLSVIDELRASEAGTKGLTSDGSYRAFVARTFEVFDDTEVVIDRVVEQGDEAALFLRFRARTKDGRRIEARGSGYVRFAGGKIAEAENLWDLLGLFASLGEPLEGVTTFSDAIARVGRRREATS